MNSMIDVAKIADLVLLMIDGSYGFEMVRPKLASYWFISISHFFFTWNLTGNVRVPQHPPIPRIPKSHRCSLPPRPH